MDERVLMAFPNRADGSFSTLKLLLSPSVAFALNFSTIGYYIFATYASLASAEGSGPAITYRTLAAIMLLAAVFGSRQLRLSLPSACIPGFVFLVIYLFRMLENVLLENVYIPPGNDVVFSIFIVNGILPSLLLPIKWRCYTPHDTRIVLSLLSAAFVIGALVLVGRLDPATDSSRLAFDKVNPISLAYVCSTFLLYYLVVARTSKYATIEAMVIVPLLLFIGLQAKSRGMMISTSATVALYLVLLRGGQRLAMIALVGVLAIIASSFLDPAIFERAFMSVERINTASDMSTAMRVLSFRGAYEQFLADPAFGRWVNEQHTGYYPHNIYLESLMAVGFIGSIPFALHLSNSVVAAISILRLKNTNWVWTFFALLFFREAIGSASSGSISGNTTFWISSFLVITVWQRYRGGMHLVGTTQLSEADIERGAVYTRSPGRMPTRTRP